MQRRRTLTIAGPAVLAAILVSLLGLASMNASPASGHGDDAQLKHIFVIMLENHSQNSVIDDPNAPFITSLAHTYGMAANYYGVTHPSEPNYVATISGSNWFVNDDNPNNRFDHTNLVDQLEASHHSWGAYMESMPSVGLSRRQCADIAQRPTLREQAQSLRALQRHPQQPCAFVPCEALLAVLC